MCDCGDPTTEDGADGAEAVDKPDDDNLMSPSSGYTLGEVRL